MDFIWQSAIDFWDAHFYISPFWYYVLWAVGIIAAVSFAAWFFPVLRSLAGAIVVAVIAALYAYRKGETDAEKHAAKTAKTKTKQKQDDWWWGGT